MRGLLRTRLAVPCCSLIESAKVAGVEPRAYVRGATLLAAKTREWARTYYSSAG